MSASPMTETPTFFEPLVLHGDCLDILREIPDDTIDAIVTDPPYLLGFMGREWDTKQGHEHLDWHRAWCDEAYRVLKPGGHMLAFGGTRTWHRLACAVEDAGFEVRDSIAWLYGSGFPKSLDVSKAIDKAAGAEREVVGQRTSAYGTETATGERVSRTGGGAGLWVGAEAKAVPLRSTEAATPDAERWQGWGTALKPAFEPIVVARKPFKGTVAANVLEHGTGALNIDATRIGQPDGFGGGAKGAGGNSIYGDLGGYEAGDGFTASTQGRWPANVILGHTEDCEPVGTRKIKSQNPQYSRPQEDERQDGRSSYVTPKRPEGVGIGHADADGMETIEAWECADGCPVKELDAQSGTSSSKAAAKSRPMQRQDNEVYGKGLGSIGPENTYSDSGGASRFFYCAKAPKRERPVIVGEDGKKTVHPTVKPLALMRWLIRLVTPPGGIVLDPFVGSGTTIEAGMLEGFEVWGIEGEEDYLPLIQQRIDRVMEAAS